MRKFVVPDSQLNPKVTICVYYYNDRNYLKTCIDSILNQDYKNFELILFNHSSTDGSYEIAHSYDDERIIHVDAPKNLGAGASYNNRFVYPFVNGKYFKPFCADDVMNECCLSSLVEYLENNPDINLVFGNMEYIDSNGKDLKKDFFKEHKTLKYSTEIDILKIFSNFNNKLPYPGALIKTDVMKEIINDNSLTICADMWLWASAIINGAKVGLCNKIIANYRRHEYQESFLNNEIMIRRTEYEKSAFLSLFFSVKNIELTKKIFEDSPYKDKLTSVDDISFYVAEYYLRKNGYQFAYDKLFNLLKDESTAKHLEETFGFGVLEFRKLYAFKPLEKNFKKYIYTKRGKNLTITELAFLLSYRLIQALGSKLTLKFLRK